jgi:hypothetical protein
MDVTHTPAACTLAAAGQPGCGCQPKPKSKSSAAAKAAAIAAGTAAACTACCVLPFALPAIVLANIGGVIALVDHAHGWVTWMAIAAVAGAWIWIGRQTLTTRARPANSTVAMMGVATVVITLAASWPLLKPTVFHSLGITKKILDKD